MNYSKYPKNWKTEIRPRILERAGYKCEMCGVADRTIRNGSVVVLTIAHLDRDPDNHMVKDDRLQALCQACHLAYDRDANVKNKKYGRDHSGPHQLKLEFK